MPKVTRLGGNEEEGLVVSIQRKIPKRNYLATRRIRCGGWPTLIEGIQAYVETNCDNWNLRRGESIGFFLRGQAGYNPRGVTLKTVDFYRLPYMR